jgi:hypothetical protein
MRNRAIAVMTALVVGATPAAVLATSATAKTKAKVGQKCTKGKKAPTGFVCKKNAKGKYVLAKK